MRLAPYFLDTFPAARRPSYPTFSGSRIADVVVVGGGLTGCACAANFAAAGHSVVLLEQDRIGVGATAGGPGLARQDLDAPFSQAAADHGVRTARHLWRAARRGTLDFAAALRRWGIQAEVQRQDVVWLSRGQEEPLRALRREYQARHAAGLDATWLSNRMLRSSAAIAVDGGLRIAATALDPYRVCIGLAAVAVRKGAVLFERSAARRLRHGAKAITVGTDKGEITAGAVIVATGDLPDDLRALRRHFTARQTCGVVTGPLPAVVRRELGHRDTALLDSDVPPHLLRWLKGDRVLFSGREQAASAPHQRERGLTARANELMYELTTLYPAISGVPPMWAWEAVHHESADGLPVIGPHRNFPRYLFALGLGTHGPGASWLAARLLLRAFMDEADKEDEPFGFARIL